MVRLRVSRFTFLSFGEHVNLRTFQAKEQSEAVDTALAFKGSTSLVHVIQKPAESAFWDSQGIRAHLAVQVINALKDGTGAQDPAFNANSAKLKTRERGGEDLHCSIFLR